MTHDLVRPLLLVALLAGCGGSSIADPASSDGGADAATADHACDDLARARCAKLQSCSAQELATRDGDLATCTTREKASCLSGLAAPGTASTASTASACAAALTAASCGEFLANTPIPACAAKAGSLASGAPCGFASQCQTTFCAVPKGSVCGTCASVPKVGDSCATIGCGPGLHCGKTSQTCLAFVARDGACDGDKVCDVGLGCVTAKGATAGTCQPLVAAEGAACEAREQTLPTCDRAAGLWCPSTGKCACVTGYAKGGEPCGLVDATSFFSCSSGACVVVTGGAGKGTCAAASAEGGPCDTEGNGPSCIVGTRCKATGGTTGTCVSTATCK